jgi:hypothetical protein
VATPGFSLSPWQTDFGTNFLRVSVRLTYRVSVK